MHYFDGGLFLCMCSSAGPSRIRCWGILQWTLPALLQRTTPLSLRSGAGRGISPKDLVWVAGEALIDLLPPRSPGETGVAAVGGGAANTAKCLAQLGVPTMFIGGLSTADPYGKLIEDDLSSAGVMLDRAHRAPMGTCLAKVAFDEAGRATYEFKIERTATFDFKDEWLPSPTNPPSLLHTGTLATIIEPGASVLHHWAQRLQGEGVPIIYDPNVRPAVMSQRDEYVRSIEKWVSLANVVKASEEDLHWLYPDVTATNVALDWVRRGSSLVVVTKGDCGLMACTSRGTFVEVPAVEVNVADTVGAGDTVGAVLCEAAALHGLAKLVSDEATLRSTLNRAAFAAAITCSRVGCKPPTLDDLAKAI